VSAAAVIESSDVLAGANLVAAGLGVGIVPGLGVIPWPGIVLVPVTPKVARRLYAVTIAGDASTPLRALVQELRAASAGLAS
jgi:DNA-binding transcriptional LysR family regulator